MLCQRENGPHTLNSIFVVSNLPQRGFTRRQRPRRVHRDSRTTRRCRLSRIHLIHVDPASCLATTRLDTASSTRPRSARSRHAMEWCQGTASRSTQLAEISHQPSPSPATLCGSRGNWWALQRSDRRMDHLPESRGAGTTTAGGSLPHFSAGLHGELLEMIHEHLEGHVVRLQ